jgi:LacI family transcriptional regulator
MTAERTHKGEPTIIDVAAEARVSRSTAGRALSGHPAVDPQTREQVLEAAARLRYRVNPAARALRRGSSQMVGLIVTNLVNASIQTLVESVHALAHTAGFQVLMAVTNGDPDREREVLAALTDHRVAGVIVMSSSSDPAQLHALEGQGIAVVDVIRRPRGIRTAVVLNDDRAGAIHATDYLVGLGHRDIAFIGGPTDTQSGSQRFAGYSSVLERHEIELDETIEWGAETAGRLFDSMAASTALLVANHEAMFGVLNVAAQRGLRIPDELSLVGFEDAPLFRYWHPAITVVDTDPGSLAADAWQSLAAAMADPAERGSRKVVPAHLVVRDSCAPPRGAA